MTWICVETVVSLFYIIPLGKLFFIQPLKRVGSTVYRAITEIVLEEPSAFLDDLRGKAIRVTAVT